MRSRVLPHVAALTFASLLAACGSRTGLREAPYQPALPYDASADAPPACDASVPHAYAADSAGTLYRYDPLTGQATRLGTASCGMSGGIWTMTATRQHAFLVDDANWSLYQVDLATMRCSRTAFSIGALGVQAAFGVAAADTGAGERVYVYGLPGGSGTPALFACDTSSFQCTSIGALHPAPAGAFPVNLTWNEQTGHLFAFAPQLTGANVFELDPRDATVLSSSSTGVTTNSTWATIAYGSNLLLWVGSDVVGYDLAARARTTTHGGAPPAVGASGFLDCP